MADPKWFDEEYYLTGKVAQLKSLDAQYRDWKVDDVKKAFSDAGLTAYEHFTQFGHSEWISPSESFDANYYLASKALLLNEGFYGGRDTWTVQEVLASFKAAGLSAWDHYVQYGFAEGVNPSASMDTDAYCAAKAVELNRQSYDGKTDWTVADVKAAFSAAGITALQHAAEFAEQEHINVPAAEDQKAVEELLSEEKPLLPGETPSLDLDDAVAAAVAETLPSVYNLNEDSLDDNSEYTVAEAEFIKDVIKGAENYDKNWSDAKYKIADTLDHLQHGTAVVVNKASERWIADSYEIIKDAKSELSDVDAEGATELTANASDSILNVGKDIQLTKVLTVGGGNGADWIQVDNSNSKGTEAIFGGSITEKDVRTGIYAESQDSISSYKLWDAEEFFGESNKWYSDEAVNLMKGGNLLDVHGSAVTMVASTAKDTFMIQNGQASGKDAEAPGAALSIHQFHVGQDALLLVSQGNFDIPVKTSAEFTADKINQACTVNLDTKGNITLIIDWDHNVFSSWGDLNTSNDTIITLQGVQGFEAGVTTAADFFGIA